MRAIVEYHKTDILPPLVVTIVKGKEDVCVKVSLYIKSLHYYNVTFQIKDNNYFKI